MQFLKEGVQTVDRDIKSVKLSKGKTGFSLIIFRQ